MVSALPTDISEECATVNMPDGIRPINCVSTEPLPVLCEERGKIMLLSRYCDAVMLISELCCDGQVNRKSSFC